jgi:hypothetical protein
MAKKGGVLDQALQRLKRGKQIIGDANKKTVMVAQLKAGDKILSGMGDVLTVLGTRVVTESSSNGNGKHYYTVIIYDDYTESLPLSPSQPIYKLTGEAE